MEATHRLALARAAREVRPLAETSCFERFNRWGGGMAPGFACAGPRSDQQRCALGELEWEVSVDDTRCSGPTSTPRVPGADTERGRRKKGLLNPEEEALGRSPGAVCRPRCTWPATGQGRPALGGRDPRSAPRPHAARATARRGAGSASGRLARQAARKRPSHLIAEREATAWRVAAGYCVGEAHPPHHPRAQRPEKERRAGRQGRRPGLRPRSLPEAQCAREVRKNRLSSSGAL